MLAVFMSIFMPGLMSVSMPLFMFMQVFMRRAAAIQWLARPPPSDAP
jgi:hypothetical protein